jgi:hypothetical protein
MTELLFRCGSVLKSFGRRIKIKRIGVQRVGQGGIPTPIIGL